MPLLFRGEHALDQGVFVGIPPHRFNVNADPTLTTKRRYHHVLGVRNIELNGGIVQCGLAVWTVRDGWGLRSTVVSVGQKGADQGATGEMPIAVGLESISGRPLTLGPGGQGAKEGFGIPTQIRQAKTPNLY